MPWLNVFGFSAGTLSTQCSPPWASATSRLKIRRNVYFPCLPCTWERLSSALCCPRSKMPCLSSGGSCHFVAPPPLHFEVSTDHAHAPLILPCALSGFILALCTCVSAFKHPTFGVQYALMHTPPPLHRTRTHHGARVCTSRKGSRTRHTYTHNHGLNRYTRAKSQALQQLRDFLRSRDVNAALEKKIVKWVDFDYGHKYDYFNQISGDLWDRVCASYDALQYMRAEQMKLVLTSDHTHTQRTHACMHACARARTHTHTHTHTL